MWGLSHSVACACPSVSARPLAHVSLTSADPPSGWAAVHPSTLTAGISAVPRLCQQRAEPPQPPRARDPRGLALARGAQRGGDTISRQPSCCPGIGGSGSASQGETPVEAPHCSLRVTQKPRGLAQRLYPGSRSTPVRLRQSLSWVLQRLPHTRPLGVGGEAVALSRNSGRPRSETCVWAPGHLVRLVTRSHGPAGQWAPPRGAGSTGPAAGLESALEPSWAPGP